MSLQKTKSNTLGSITVERHHNSTDNQLGAIAHLEHHIDVLQNLLQLLSSRFVQQGKIAMLSTLMIGTQQVDQITFYVFPHTTEQDSQPTTSLISKQAIPYQTHGSTCCPGVFTPKTRCLINSSMTIHNTWHNPTVSTIPSHAQTTTSILTTVTHITTNEKPKLSTITQPKLNIIKMKRLVWHSWLHG
jgi:hypothetical protein